MTEQKIEQFWRDATAEDVARVMKGEKVEARFRDGENCNWTIKDRFLNGYDSTDEDCKWISGSGCPYAQCQVYDPPKWFLNKPDPGDGYRLLKKFPDEPKLATDDFFWIFDKTWTQVGDTRSNQYHGVWYRRRIEPANSPEKLDSCVAYETKIDEVIQLPNGKRFKVTHAGFEVL